MGQGEGPGCYCRVNAALKTVLQWLITSYDLILVDNEAGLEHLSCYRLSRVDLFWVVTTPAPAAQAVARRVLETAGTVGVKIGESGLIFNRATGSTGPAAAIVPPSQALIDLEGHGQPVVNLPDNDPVRLTLTPLLERLLARETVCA